jgi:hypothetical protein
VRQYVQHNTQHTLDTAKESPGHQLDTSCIVIVSYAAAMAKYCQVYALTRISAALGTQERTVW